MDSTSTSSASSAAWWCAAKAYHLRSPSSGMTISDCQAITETVAHSAAHPPLVMAKIQLLPDHDCQLPASWRKSACYCRRCGSGKVSRRLAHLPHYCCSWCSGPSGCLTVRLMSFLYVLTNAILVRFWSIVFRGETWLLNNYVPYLIIFWWKI